MGCNESTEQSVDFTKKKNVDIQKHLTNIAGSPKFETKDIEATIENAEKNTNQDAKKEGKNEQDYEFESPKRKTSNKKSPSKSAAA